MHIYFKAYTACLSVSASFEGHGWKTAETFELQMGKKIENINKNWIRKSRKRGVIYLDPGVMR